MNYEDLFLLMCIVCFWLLSLNIALFDSRCFWKSKWEKELDNNVKNKN